MFYDLCVLPKPVVIAPERLKDVFVAFHEFQFHLHLNREIGDRIISSDAGSSGLVVVFCLEAESSFETLDEDVKLVVKELVDIN